MADQASGAVNKAVKPLGLRAQKELAALEEETQRFHRRTAAKERKEEEEQREREARAEVSPRKNTRAPLWFGD
jgi:hypothetical protein